MRITWDNSFDLGIPELDAEHRELVETYNQLVDAWQAGGSFVEPVMIVNELTGKVRYHATREENLLADHGYPEIADHRRDHDDFVRAFEDLERRILADGALDLKDGTLRQLGDRLVRHTKGDDDDAVAFLKGKGTGNGNGNGKG